MVIRHSINASQQLFIVGLHDVTRFSFSFFWIFKSKVHCDRAFLRESFTFIVQQIVLIAFPVKRGNIFKSSISNVFSVWFTKPKNIITLITFGLFAKVSGAQHTSSYNTPLPVHNLVEILPSPSNLQDHSDLNHSTCNHSKSSQG